MPEWLQEQEKQNTQPWNTVKARFWEMTNSQRKGEGHKAWEYGLFFQNIAKVEWSPDTLISLPEASVFLLEEDSLISFSVARIFVSHLPKEFKKQRKQ